MEKMKIISMLRNSKVRISLIVLMVFAIIVSIISWPVSEAETPINVVFRSAEMGFTVGSKSVAIQEVNPEDSVNKAIYDNVYCIDEGNRISFDTYNKEYDLYNAAECSKYFRNYNSMLWLVDNMYVSTSNNSEDLLEHLSGIVTSPEVRNNVTSYGTVTPEQIKALNKRVGGNKDIFGNVMDKNLIEVIEQFVMWNYTNNTSGADNSVYDSDIQGAMSGLTAEEQNSCRYLYFALKYLAGKNANYSSTGKTSNVVVLDASSAVIDSQNKKVGPYALKTNGAVYGLTSKTKSNITITLTTENGSTQTLGADSVVINNDGSFYISTASVENVSKVKFEIAGIYSGSSVDAKVIVNGVNQNLLNVKKTATTHNLEDEKELSYAGSYSVNLIKTARDGVTPIKNNPAKFTISGAVSKNGELTNSEGVLEIASNRTIQNSSATDSYTIVEDEAPIGYQKYNGTVELNVKFKTNGTTLVVDENNTTVNGTGTNGTVNIKFPNTTTINVYIPNEAELELHKGVKEVYNQDSGYNKDEVQDWVIQTQLPQSIESYTKLVITDKIDNRLKFLGTDKVKVKIVDGAELKLNQDYKVSFDEETETLTVTLIDGEFKGKNLKANDIIEVRYNAVFKLDKDGHVIGLNESVPNQATLKYNDGSGEKKIVTEKPEVHTGVVGLYKFDDLNRNGEHDKGEPALEGAHFKIATTEENAKKNVFVKDASGKDLEAISNEHGVAVFEGLEFGEDAMDQAKYKTGETIFGKDVYKYDWSKVETEYYIVETESPEGYSKIEKVIPATVKKDKYDLKKIESLISVANVSNIFDLSLRKFITAVDDKKITDRVAQVDLTELKSGKSTTAKYTHTKEPVLVATNQIVTYTLRVYNEGPQDAYASVIKDDIPEGLEFVAYKVGDGSVNDVYKWKLLGEDGKVVTDPSKAKYVTTTYLSKDKTGKNLIKAYRPETMKELDYRDVKIQFKVTEPNTSDRILINKAQISEETDLNGKIVKDRDSTPDKWIEGEDDQDIEKVKVLYFDLALRKWVTEAIVTENGKTTVVPTGHKAEDDPEDVVKVDLKKSKIDSVVIKFRYSIRITNEGEIAGEATEIRDDIPEGLKFLPEDNPDWRIEDGKVVTNKLANTTLQPGESAEVEIVLTWINKADNMGVKVNVAEISKDHNIYGSKDIDSTPGNYVKGEDDIDDAPVMLTVKTGSNIIGFLAMTLAVLSVVGAGSICIKKFVM